MKQKERQKISRSQHIIFMITLLVIGLLAYSKVNASHFTPELKDLNEEYKTQLQLEGILANQKIPDLKDLEGLKREIAVLEKALENPESKDQKKVKRNPKHKRLISSVIERNKALAAIYRSSYGLVDLVQNKSSVGEKIKKAQLSIQTYKHRFYAQASFHDFYLFFKKINELPWLIQTEKIAVKNNDKNLYPSIVWEISL